MLELALRYGQALYSLAKDLNKVEDWQKDLKEIKGLLKDNPGFVLLLNNAFLSQEERKELISKCFVGVDEELVSFIKVIIDNNRINYIFDILDSFNTLCNQSFGVMEGIIYSVEPLNEKQINDIENKISKKENVRVELKNLIDKSLIGGLKVVISNRIYDGSIKFHLNRMKSTLLK